MTQHFKASHTKSVELGSARRSSVQIEVNDVKSNKESCGAAFTSVLNNDRRLRILCIACCSLLRCWDVSSKYETGGRSEDITPSSGASWQSKSRREDIMLERAQICRQAYIPFFGSLLYLTNTTNLQRTRQFCCEDLRSVVALLFPAKYRCSMAPTHKIRVAISGGGLAGAAVARALLHQPHLEVHIYESAPEFSERGLGIGMAVNAQTALKHLVGDIDSLFTRTGAVSMNSTRIMMVCNPHCP
jgi:hypothetical protein